MNRALWTSLVSIGAAQAMKIPGRIRESGRWEWKDLVRTGGMPSSHSAGVAALAAYLGVKKGVSSPFFSLSALLGVIVIYDAMGIRRHTGLIASEVNHLEKTVVKLTEKSSPHLHQKREKELEEKLGHLPEEVLGGALLGTLIGWISAVTEPASKGRAAKASQVIRRLWARLT
ncbi:divergent PAP2 family protein [Paenibacillus filicis]|uniref:Divergent PAP2 family protein n=1 Tax=Paenibacillus gyeongsangnamensis TaxID=3388067 RepID=A0ABT4Q3Q4_9BACL|nr:divergent PAP2 family protein [Paenibacillus filicis]MCZ8511330.1 divergent PAP2 family protein [Paenibacillus filicis]